MKKILIVSFSNIQSDPRVQRQIKTLKNQYSLTVLGFGDHCGHEDINFITIQPPVKRQNKIRDAFDLLTKRFENFYLNTTYVQETIQNTKGLIFDLVIANDIEALPLSLKMFPHSKIWYDAHEYSPKEFENNLKWRILFRDFKSYLCRTYMKQAQKITTVCDGLALEFEKNFGIKVDVIRNATEFCELTPSEVNHENIRIIHHGAAIRARHIEKMILLMDHIDDRFEMNFILMPTDTEYLVELKNLALSRKNQKIKFLDPVPFEEIPRFINQFDLGLFILEPVNFNYKYALPNKLFEFVQARLGILIGPSPEMAKIVNTYNLGIINPNFNLPEFGKTINALTVEEINKFKKSSHMHAKELSFEAESKKIKEIVATLI